MDKGHYPHNGYVDRSGRQATLFSEEMELLLSHLLAHSVEDIWNDDIPDYGIKAKSRNSEYEFDDYILIKILFLGPSIVWRRLFTIFT